MKKFAPFIVLTLLLFVSVNSSSGNEISLSKDAKISLLTASPGDELYSVFGHSALRVKDHKNNIDAVFNYGTFDFNTPNFYMKFARGKLLYKLSVNTMPRFMQEYQAEGRAVYEQVFNLNQEEKQMIFDFLMWNRLPENAYYHYDFFYDNCATRIRDLFDEQMSLKWEEAYYGSELLAQINALLDYEFQYQAEFNYPKTFRDLLQPFLLQMPWSKFGIDLALGLPADKIAEPYHFMYLPDEMLIGFAMAQKPNGEAFVSEYNIIIPKKEPLSPANTLTPTKAMWLIFILGILSLLNPKSSRIFDKVFFSSLGVLGLGVVFLWFFTDHITTKTNLNILWAIPFHLYFIWVANYKSNRPLVKTYFRMVFFLSVGLLLFWNWIPQAYNPAFFPLVLMVVVKTAFYGIPEKLKVYLSEQYPTLLFWPKDDIRP